VKLPHVLSSERAPHTPHIYRFSPAQGERRMNSTMHATGLALDPDRIAQATQARIDSRDLAKTLSFAEVAGRPIQDGEAR